MDWKARHREAFDAARKVCKLESVGQLALALAIAAGGIVFLWMSAGPNEAWSEMLLRTGVIIAVILIFPVIYLWNLFHVGLLAQRNARMLLVLGLFGFVVSSALVLAGVLLESKRATNLNSSELSKLQRQVELLQKQLASSSSKLDPPVSAPSPQIAASGYNERDVRELLDYLEEANALIERRILPVTNAVTAAMANWSGYIPNIGVKNSVQKFKEMREQLRTDVWEPINALVYGASNRHPDELRAALVLDHEAAKGELSRSMQVAIDALAKLPENPSEQTRDLVKPQFNEAYKQAEIVYSWLVLARDRIAIMKNSLKTKGELGIEIKKPGSAPAPPAVLNQSVTSHGQSGGVTAHTVR